MEYWILYSKSSSPVNLLLLSKLAGRQHGMSRDVGFSKQSDLTTSASMSGTESFQYILQTRLICNNKHDVKKRNKLTIQL